MRRLKIFFIFFILSSSSIASELFAPAEVSKDFSQDSIQRTNWILSQNKISNAYFNSHSEKKYFEAFFKSVFNKPRIFQEYESKDKSFVLRLKTLGVERSRQLEKIENQNKTTLLFDSFSTANSRNGYLNTLNFFSVSPDEKFVVLINGIKGNSDRYQMIVLDINTGVQTDIIQDVYLSSNYLSWVNSRDIIFGVSEGRNLVYKKYEIAKTPTKTTVVTCSKSSLCENIQNGTNYQNFLGTNFVYAESNDGQPYLRLSQNDSSDWVRIDSKINSIISKGYYLYTYSGGARGFGEIQKRSIFVKESKELLIGSATTILKESEKGEKILEVWGNADRVVVFSRAPDRKNLRYYTGIGDQWKSFSNIPQSANLSHVKFLEDKKLQLTWTSHLVKAKSVIIDLKKEDLDLFDLEKTLMTDEEGATYITKYVNVSSSDKKSFQMRVVHRADLKMDGSHPTLLQGYGGFGLNANFEPYYQDPEKVFLKKGGILAYPAIRGGGEYGSDWAYGARREAKQKSFDDFIAAVEFLIENKYTSSSKIAAMGASNGGLLMGAVLTQRPDLFKLVIAVSGVFDMAKKEIWDFDQSDGWSFEYGKSTDSSIAQAIMAYSPVQNAKPAIYPTVLLLSGRNDSRVNPAHSYAFIDKLQKVQKGSNPILLSSINNAGHYLQYSFDSIDLQAWRSAVLIWSTIFHELGVKIPNE